MASVWGELKRRNVVKVAVAYAIVSWLLLQVADVVLDNIEAPTWVFQAILLLLVIGFPVAIIFAWAFELTPEGIKKEKDVDRSVSVTHLTGRKLDFIIIGVMAIAIAYFLTGKFVWVGEELPTGVAVSEDRKSIAVLPFANRSNDEEDSFFVDGIHDDIITQLAKISSLKVISRTSVMGYRNTTKNMRTIGEELGVATLLEGGIQRAGEQVRINFQLIDANTDEHLWAETYNRELTAANIFQIQELMATEIATALQATLLPQEVARLNEVPTQNTRAYDFYLSAREYHRDPDQRTNLPLAVQQYQRATEEDPEFAVAFAHLSVAQSEMYWFALDRTESQWRALSLAAAQQALILQPDLPEAHLAMATYHYRGFLSYDEALRELAIAEQGMRGRPEIYRLRAPIYRRMGQWEMTLADHARFVELDPRNAQVLIASVAYTYQYLRDYAEAERILDRALEIAPDAAYAYFYKARILLLRDGDVSRLKELAVDPSAEPPNVPGTGWHVAIYERDTDTTLSYLNGWDVEILDDRVTYRPKSSFYGVTYQLAGQPELAEPYFHTAQAQLEQALETNPDDFRIYMALAEVLAGLGDREGAVQAAEQAMALMSPSRDAVDGRTVQFAAIIRVFAVIQDHDRVIQELDDYLGARGGEWSIEGLLPDPRLDLIRDDPRFQSLVEKYKRQ